MGIIERAAIHDLHAVKIPVGDVAIGLKRLIVQLADLRQIDDDMLSVSVVLHGRKEEAVKHTLPFRAIEHDRFQRSWSVVELLSGSLLKLARERNIHEWRRSVAQTIVRQFRYRPLRAVCIFYALG